MTERWVGIDVGAETVKAVELRGEGGELRWTRHALSEHHKEPARALRELLRDWDWDGVAGAAVVGRASTLVDLLRVPTKQAQAEGLKLLHPDLEEATVVSIGGHGFSVLELRTSGVEVMRQNSRCSQGTGNFLRQLTGRFDLTIEQASALCEDVEDPAPLSGRCPVILKTDMTHLANKGTSHARILAGLYDAVCENVQVLIKPRVSPAAVMLAGGVSRSARVRAHFERFLARHDMRLLPPVGEGGVYLDALGAASVAARRSARAVPLDRLVLEPPAPELDRVGSLADSLHGVRRMKASPVAPADGGDARLVLGFDIGSTGSKVVAIDVEGRAVWESYVNTNGNPVAAAQALMRHFVEAPVGARPVVAFGATGSGREIVGSMLSTCYGADRVCVINEIAAHAEGALSWDRRVDTIFEIGGQDAKYIRLSEGRVVDAAMNEACSAGTGSFIEEQGKKFSGIDDVVQLGQEALRSEGGVSLGQHCSVFMAEVIDGAVSAGVDNRSVIAGIYDSVVQNYLNRVKGNRSVGQVVFCQGMPFASDALAAAVVRQTGSEVVVPPNPGTVGALGIALLARKEMGAELAADGVDPERFLAAEVVRKDTFVCKATRGCGSPGNRCKIDRIQTRVGRSLPRFTWGGSCSLWDKGTGKRKLPDLTPDPFRERQEIIDELLARVTRPRGRRRVGLTDEFQLKGLFPFFATFFDELGFDVVVAERGDHAKLKRGIEEANVPFCAPMQLYHGVVSELAERDVDVVFAPMLREIPTVSTEKHAVTCPIVQASPDILRWDLGEELGEKILSPVFDVGGSDLFSAPFLKGCQQLAAALGVPGIGWWEAFRRAHEAQRSFDAKCFDLGRRALAFCDEHELVPVVVLGRPYTIYNPVLSSNVPPLLREQGAVAIPIDCYPVDESVPALDGVYWGFGQRNLRAAHQIRRTPGVHSLWCSNYSCGPDSFNLHFYAHAMEGKPFAVIETDGHAGDAGTKTRIEAFLHCVREDLSAARGSEPNDLRHVDRRTEGLDHIRGRRERILIPRMGAGAEALAACLNGIGVEAEALPEPDRESLRLGRRYTSGKECVPMCITLGSLLSRLERERETDRRFAFFMPTANGPCRFGVYNMLHRTVLSRLGWADRVSIWSPNDADYFEGLPPGFAALVVTGFAASDMLLEALYHVRPVETRPGAAQAVYDRYRRELLALLEGAAQGDLSIARTLLQTATGRLFGCADLLRRAALDLRAVRSSRDCPTVMLVGEIYVRCDPFANDFVVEKLEREGLRVRFAPFVEWLEYSDWLSLARGERRGVGAQLSAAVQKRIVSRAYESVAEVLDWPTRTTVAESLEAARPYIRDELAGEAVLTLGGPVHEHRHGLIDGVVSVGPLECMPNKIAETQLFHVAEREGLASLTLPLNGDPLDAEVLSSFAFEVRSRHARRQAHPADRHRASPG